jgi:transposase InsO family protein
VVVAGTTPTAPDVPVLATAAAATTAHQERLQALFAARHTVAPRARRRGSTWQQPRRQLEQAVRHEAVVFRHGVAARGLNRIESAACLGVAVRTLRDWEDAAATAGLAWAVRGRPVLRSERPPRTAVLELLASVGPGVGLAVLQGQFPEMPRAELADLLRRYRQVCVRRHQQALHVLHWQRPGAVWAMDYAEPPLPLEEGFTDLLAVRDLASGFQLLWLPVPSATAATTVAALLSLFMLYGAPLVLKMDNGSPFVAALTQELLAQWQVVPLYSPPGVPQYNGAIEAGLGGLKVLTHYQAARGGHPGGWTLADTAAARDQANTLGRPWGAPAPTPAERWAGRHGLTATERRAFTATVRRLQEEAAWSSSAGATGAAVADGAPSAAAERTGAAGCPPAAPATPTAGPAGPGQPCPEHPGPPTAAPPREVPTKDRPSGADGRGREAWRPRPERAAAQRQAISRALVAHGYLLFTRRRIPLPITRKKVSEIT